MRHDNICWIVLSATNAVIARGGIIWLAAGGRAGNDPDVPNLHTRAVGWSPLKHHRARPHDCCPKLRAEVVKFVSAEGCQPADVL